jgi:5S rRNA maturation endonuclease (ribonuclease M5)
MDNPHIPSEIMVALREKINQALEQCKGKMVTEELKAVVQLKVEQSIKEIEEIYNISLMYSPYVTESSITGMTIHLN